MALSIFGRSKPPAATVTTEEGFVDIGLAIAQAKKSADGMLSLVARGSLEGSVVGFAVDILPEWKAKKVEDSEVTLYWGKARCRSLGPESDQFLSTLAKLYGVTPHPDSMAARIEATAVGLDTDPRLVETDPVKLKLFFEGEGEDRYAEVFVNVDVQGKWLSFNEKDQDYRSPLVRALHEGA